jgi:hypothetical protein
VNHFKAQPGAKGRKTDWGRTWENWIHTAIEREPASRRPVGAGTGSDRQWDAYRRAVEASRTDQPERRAM